MKSDEEFFTPPFPGATYEWFVECSIPQSMTFAIDILPDLNDLMNKYSYGTKLKVLDAGAGSGAGSNLIGSIYRGKFMRCILDIDAVEIFPNYENYAKNVFNNINYIVGDAFDIAKSNSYDWVISSHVIEHFKDPTDFIKRLQDCASDYVVLYAPFCEKNLLEGHLKSITQDYIESLEPIYYRTLSSVGWRHPKDDVSACVVIVLPGKKKKE
ncbi:class I SAM-dependent methyltransferase [Azospirillum palustre]